MTAFVLDFDGTLVDSVYAHVAAWHGALRECGLDLAMWRIHRKIGMSGSLLMRALETELDRKLDDDLADRLKKLHGRRFAELRSSIQPFPGAQDFLNDLRNAGVRYAIATSGNLQDLQPLMDLLEIGDVPIVSQKDVPAPKPDPALFLEAAKRLGHSPGEIVVVGDSVWDMLAARRAHALGVGLLTGGYAEDELTRAGAYRVYADPAQLRRHLHEVGVQIDRKE